MLRGMGLYLYNIVCGSHPNAVTIRMKGNSAHKTKNKAKYTFNGLLKTAETQPCSPGSMGGEEVLSFLSSHVAWERG